MSIPHLFDSGTAALQFRGSHFASADVCEHHRPGTVWCHSRPLPFTGRRPIYTPIPCIALLLTLHILYICFCSPPPPLAASRHRGRHFAAAARHYGPLPAAAAREPAWQTLMKRTPLHIPLPRPMALTLTRRLAPYGSHHAMLPINTRGGAIMVHSISHSFATPEVMPRMVYCSHHRAMTLMLTRGLAPYGAHHVMLPYNPWRPHGVFRFALFRNT